MAKTELNDHLKFAKWCLKKDGFSVKLINYLMEEYSSFDFDSITRIKFAEHLMNHANHIKNF